MTAQIRVCRYYDAPDTGLVINTCSRGRSDLWRRLSPFVLGPVNLYGGRTALNVENAWQFSKLYTRHANAAGEPTEGYWRWAQAGWANPRAVRYPMGKGARPLCSLWGGEHLDYITARRRIYAPLYAGAVRRTQAYRELRALRRTERLIWLRDFDGYDHVALGRDYPEVVADPRRKMGHAFVLAMLLEDRYEEVFGTPPPG